MSQSQGLLCPNCANVLPIPEGARIVECLACGLHSLVQGERGIRHWQVHRQVERDEAQKRVQGFWRGLNKARDLPRQARISHLFLVYLPYWRVQAFVAGWIFGRVRKDEDETRPVEVEIFEEMHWNDAAVDVSEYGVQRVQLRKEQLEPYDAEALHSEAMVFEPTESRTEALTEATEHFAHRGRRQRSLKQQFFEKFHFLRQRLSLVYYPLWVARYEYKQRHYQVVVDGVRGKILYGKAPGNIFYRAAALVAGMALGNLVLVNGIALLSRFVIFVETSSNDDNSIAILLFPIVIAIGLMVWGYRSFRYGEEVEERDKSNRKSYAGRASLPQSLGGNLPSIDLNNRQMDTLVKMGMEFLDDL